jgi:group I intron endonuclease
MKLTGIYQIQSKIKPERIYIGSAVDINHRWWQHLKELNKGTHHSRKLQGHYNKYGKNDLVFSILIKCEKPQLLQFEQYYLDFYHPTFNIAIKAGSRLGLKASEETIIRISKGHIGQKAWNKGLKMSKEHCMNLSIAHLGQKSIFRGISQTKEHIEKLRKTRIGRKQSEETVQKRILSYQKPVLQYDLQGNFVKEWSSVRGASRVLLLSHNKIYYSLKVNKPMGDYIWKYKKDILKVA